MKPGQRLKLQLNLMPLWAEEVLRDRGGGLTARELQEMTLLATGDKDKAEKAMTDRIAEEMRAGKTPEV